jgi:hypothetical protein
MQNRHRRPAVDDREKILKSLAEAPRDAGQLSSLLGISRDTLFSTLMKMEKEELIVWDDTYWSIAPSSGHEQPPSSRPGELGDQEKGGHSAGQWRSHR